VLEDNYSRPRDIKHLEDFVGGLGGFSGYFTSGAGNFGFRSFFIFHKILNGW
jgi:hypothetical protein